MAIKRIYMAVSLVVVALAPGCSKAPTVSFTSDVMPVLDKHCKKCHQAGGEGAVKSGFIVDTFDSVMAGTTLGPMVVAGDPLSSNLYRMVAREVDKSIRMPHGESTLDVEERALIKTWIAEGALDN
ncbi:MAG: c-type cytochrome domain-containing protein [Gammaproteobacteria bacterium]